MDTETLSFLRSRPVAVIASVDGEGYPNAKAMLSPRLIEGNVLWFSTNTSSMRVVQYRQNPKACVYFFRKGLFRYRGVMIVGEMEVLEDQPSKDRLWRRGDTVYYPKGQEDPDYCVLRFTAKRGRMYRDLKTRDIEV